MDDIEKDLNQTLEFRKALFGKKNLMYWYRQLFNQQLAVGKLKVFDSPKILEIGSGASPFKEFYPELKTSDVQKLSFLDYVFDAHSIGECEELKGQQFDAIILTNVLHHLEKPIDFLNQASQLLRPGGQIILSEPYFSWLSNLIYRYVHHEPVDSKIKEPVLANVTGPLSSANIILPHLIFLKNKKWLEQLEGSYDLNRIDLRYFTSLSYFATGGMSKNISIPGALYSVLFALDQMITFLFPYFFASFFTISLPKKD